MENDPKSFNLRKQKSIKIKPKKRQPYAHVKSKQKVNKVIRNHNKCQITYFLKNDTIDDFILPTHTQKSSLTWWDSSPQKLKVF